MTTAWMTLREAVIAKYHRQSRHQLCCHHKKCVISYAVITQSVSSAPLLSKKKPSEEGFSFLLREIIF
jgi:hypothetical protein